MTRLYDEITPNSQALGVVAFTEKNTLNGE